MGRPEYVGEDVFDEILSLDIQAPAGDVPSVNCSRENHKLWERISFIGRFSATIKTDGRRGFRHPCAPPFDIVVIIVVPTVAFDEEQMVESRDPEHFT